MDFKGLEAKIEAAAAEAFERVRGRYPGRNFCGYALYSDPGGITVCPAVNSCDHLKGVVAEDPDDAIYYRWSPGEWDHEYEGSECFAEICEMLRKEAAGLGSVDVDQFKGNVYECCVAALESLKGKGFFSDMAESGVVVFSISDGESDLERGWAARLNDTELAEEFSKWLTSLE
ncbi:conserved hypothethical protein (plasmid) [Ralstonia solanacearum CMR15]|nr:conserved hypothethical protein [Ralstonia solanacearum CMR15]